MDSQERDALREKHRDWSGHCPACDYQSHPCDVIKVLDAWEEWLNSRTQTDTTEYPPEGQNVECDHTDGNGLCYCESDIFRCPDCKLWLGRDHAHAEVHDGSEVSTTREVCDHWVGVKGSGHYRYGSTTPPPYWTHSYCPKCGEKL